MTVHVSQKQYQKTVRETIHKGAALNRAYLLMNVLAATIASYGLLANSPAVVIGAMVVAMLLGPISGISLALVDSDTEFLRKSLFALFAGAVGVMLTAFVVGSVHKDLPITHEIMARTAPNLLDLMIALAGGIAGAYATVSPRLTIAFIGVAIATALVPPLSAASILFAHGAIDLAFGALLLTFTNVVAIQFAFSVVLWFAGFRQVTHTSGLSFLVFVKRNIVSITILVALAVVLTMSLERVAARQLYETTSRIILQREISSSVGSYLVDVRFESVPEVTIVRAVMRGPNPPSAAQVAAMEAQLPPPFDGTTLELRIRFVQTMIINRDGLLYTDIEFEVNE